MKGKIIATLICMLIIFPTISTLAKNIDIDSNENKVSVGLAKDVKLVTSVSIDKSSPLSFDPVKAFVAYDPTSSLPQGPCEFNLATPSIITSLKAWAPGEMGFCSGAAWTLAGELYMCDFSSYSSNIYKINPTTGDNILIGPSGVSLYAMTYDVTTGIMYACSGNALYKINQITGAATFIGFFLGGLSYMLMLACDKTGNMYGIDIEKDKLYNINKVTGMATDIGPTLQNLAYAQDMCFDIDTGLLYVAGWSLNLGYGALYMCDYTSGNLFLVSPFQNGAEIDAFAIPYEYNVQPDKPVITGTSSGTAGKSYEYMFTAIDINNDDIKFFINWGDGNTEDTFYLASGDAVVLSHTWSSQGSYVIYAYSEDIHGLAGPQNTFSVTMPRCKIINSPLLKLIQNYLKISSILRNLFGL